MFIATISVIDPMYRYTSPALRSGPLR